MQENGHMGETDREIDVEIQGGSRLILGLSLCLLSPSSLSQTRRLGYICAPSPLSLGPGWGQCPCHLTQGKGCICWVGGHGRGGEMGWVGSRWLSPKASAGVAGGECVCIRWGWEVGVCMCVCECWRCVWVGGRSVRLCVCVCLCLCVCVHRFSAWKDGWRGTSAEELLLVTVREKGKRGGRERRKGGMEEEKVDMNPTQLNS